MNGPYQPRVLDLELDELLPSLPAIEINGARATGKTATASARAATVYALDEPSTRAILEADPSRIVTGARPILIDEWQRMPPTWDLVRRAVDADGAGGQFLLTGSATPRVLPAHSGAGRIVSLRLRPMTLMERGVGRPTVSLAHLLSGTKGPIDGETDIRADQYAHEILASGFPGLRGRPDRIIKSSLDGYLSRVITTDFLEAGYRVRNDSALRRWLEAYGAAVSSTASYETIRDAASAGASEKPTKSSALRYADVLEGLWLIERIPGWKPTANLLSRLTLAPKHQMVDPALVARLRGATMDSLIGGDPAGDLAPRHTTLFGALFESLVTLSVLVFAQAAEGRVFHFRDYGGAHEVDLIVEGAGRRVLAIEIKLAQTVTDNDVRHLHWLKEKVGDHLLDSVIVSTGTHAYRRQDGIAVIPAALLGP